MKRQSRVEDRAEGEIETVRAALSEGLDIDLICRITGLNYPRSFRALAAKICGPHSGAGGAR